jgi:hypothetical protein
MKRRRKTMKMNKAVTLEDLEKRKQEVLKQIRKQEEVMRDTCDVAIEPLKPAVTFSQGVERAINSTVALYQGLKMGYKIAGLLSRKKRKKG